MVFEIIALGGYLEIGRNSTAIIVDDEVIIIDLGIHLDHFIHLTERDEFPKKHSLRSLMRSGSIPDIKLLGNLRKNVKGVVLSHAHLDHVGGVLHLEKKFSCNFHATKFTNAFLDELFKANNKFKKNKFISHEQNERFRISDKIEVEFISVTHSTPHAVMVLVHTKYGSILYTNDFKIDPTPVYGLETNTDRLKELNVDVLILDSLYGLEDGKCGSELKAQTDLYTELKKITTKGIFVSTFSSHIYRLLSILKIAKEMNKKVAFVGSSLIRYATAAENAGIHNFKDDVYMVKYSGHVKRFFKKLKREDWIIVTTGHQGEPNSILYRLANEYDFDFKDTTVVFSSSIIPVRHNKENRQDLENKLIKRGAKLIKDVHVSGHGFRDDEIELLNMVKPKVILPSHGMLKMVEGAKENLLKHNYKGQICFLKTGDKFDLTK